MFLGVAFVSLSRQVTLSIVWIRVANKCRREAINIVEYLDYDVYFE